ncbi:hypothetical protein DUI87_13229 [Hirundo rustica rustica]|uniref:Uncharacterized protein n=1 Tax=Hirundo rustica rustica TaxID=333673 RepID=A0A3M0KGQ0_HIRRU|nr:hypothetical protein DUI87_13229 [Hirundo rustica rustica]
MPGIHLDVWGTTWLCEKAREGSRLPPEVCLVVYKLASKAKPALEKRSAPFGVAQKHLLFGCLSEAGILHPESTRWRRQSPPFLPPQPVSPVGQVAVQQVVCLEASARAELGRRYLLKEEKSKKTSDTSIRQQRDLDIRFCDPVEPWTSPLYAGHLLSFLPKEKRTESSVEKVCPRFRTAGGAMSPQDLLFKA